MQGESKVYKLYDLQQYIYKSNQICSKVSLVTSLFTTSGYSQGSGEVRMSSKPAKTYTDLTCQRYNLNRKSKLHSHHRHRIQFLLSLNPTGGLLCSDQ